MREATWAGSRSTSPLRRPLPSAAANNGTTGGELHLTYSAKLHPGITFFSLDHEESVLDVGCFDGHLNLELSLTEGEARNRYGNIRVYSADFRPMRNVFAHRAERGLYKMITEEPSGKILGLHMIGPDSPEILQAAAIAVKAGLTKADFDATVALHPSMAEELVLMR